jgi:hypothetical protein
MGRSIALTPIKLADEPFTEFLRQLRLSHNNGGAYLVAFEVSDDPIFNWFASRNRLSDDDLIDSLLIHPVIRSALRDLAIPDSKVSSGLKLADPFQLDGNFARRLYNGGAYWIVKEDGKSAKMLALAVCEAMFGLRYGEVAFVESFAAWTSWFHNVAWDLTEIVFDRRLRRLWVFVLTDTD